MNQYFATCRAHLFTSSNQGWEMEADEFMRNLVPSGFPDITYLLYEIRWGKRHRPWRNWCRNVHPTHAEIIFLEDEDIHDRPGIPCKITWFMPWTPCGACVPHILEFLEERPNVSLEIQAAQVYRPHDKRNWKGLQDLAEEVPISIMDLSDYEYCWEVFVDNEGMDYMPPWDFSSDIWHNSQLLHSILN